MTQGKAFSWLNQREDFYGSPMNYREGNLIEGLVGKEIIDIDVNRTWITTRVVQDTVQAAP